MPRRPPFTRRWLTALTWPIGVSLTSWDYMWRSTPMHRRELIDSELEPHLPPGLPETVETGEIQGPEAGHGPLFHRLYSTGIRDTDLSARELLDRVTTDLNQAAPTSFARFEKVLGEKGRFSRGNEYVVRMPGPWDGPVRVVETGPCSFRLATLEGHLEAGQIEFRVRDAEGERLQFEIESWARSGDRLSHLMYHRLRMAKEVQAHMWISFLEGVVALSGGRMDGGVTIETRRVEQTGAMSAGSEMLAPRIRRRLAALADRSINFDPACLRTFPLPDGWLLEDRCQPLPGEAPGAPIPGGSWETAQRLIRGYEFADPSVVRAYYDHDAQLPGRDMLLRLRALGRVDIYVGVRVGEVFDEARELAGRSVRVWGWNYRTLEGHVEMGQMAWEVWKWLDTGDVEFRVHAVSRRAPIRNPVVWLGFRLFGAHERRVFLESTDRRMLRFTELGLEQGTGEESIRRAAAELTARDLPPDEASADELARNLSDSDGPS